MTKHITLPEYTKEVMSSLPWYKKLYYKVMVKWLRLRNK